MLPRIVVFKKVVLYNVKQRDKNADNGNGMEHKRASPHVQPRTAFKRIVLRPHRLEVTERTEQCCHKRCDNKKVAQLPGPQMLSYELCSHFLK